MDDVTRLDGRKYSELRPMSVQLNPLKSGPSCRISVGGSGLDCGGSGSSTSVIAVAYFSPDNKNRNCLGNYHKPTFEVYVRPASGTVTNRIRGMECVLLKTLQRVVHSENLGKILMSMRIQVLEDGGSLLSVCLNALLTCALLTGLKLREVSHAVPFGIVNRNGTESLILDPTDEELRTYCSASFTVLCDPTTGDISLFTLDTGYGGIDKRLTEKMSDLAVRAARIRLKMIDDIYKSAFDPARISFEANCT
ncbi:hypothetical protein BgAZ_203870 [Babesia gibsoni]|uniref:Uncharacterized protein n=1 Tax=Babesia gibsoni TaxID=33632 RepID=A0AAD8LQL2_BABGI|nr:hypothetical protein BgAZ_203870 [Babesia gibsoni]